MGGNSSTTTQRADPYGPSKPFLNEGLRDAGALYDAGGFRVDPWSGDMVADRDPLSMAAYNATPGVIGGALGNIGNATATATRMMDPNLTSGYLGGLVQNTIDNIMPGINSSFAGSGMTGSGLHAQNLAKGVSSGVAGVLDNAWQQGQNRALSAAGMIPGLNNAATGALDYLNNAGQGNQQQAQSELNARILQDQQAQTADLSAIQDYLALTSGVGSAFGVQSSTSRQNPGLLGMLGLGLQAAPLMLSDARLKEDIKRVGETDEGLGVYQYRYKAGGPTHIGLMAQEVIRTKPEAVKNVGGYLAVDYEKALS